MFRRRQHARLTSEGIDLVVVLSLSQHLGRCMSCATGRTLHSFRCCLQCIPDRASLKSEPDCALGHAPATCIGSSGRPTDARQWNPKTYQEHVHARCYQEPVLGHGCSVHYKVVPGVSVWCELQGC